MEEQVNNLLNLQTLKDSKPLRSLYKIIARLSPEAGQTKEEKNVERYDVPVQGWLKRSVNP